MSMDSKEDKKETRLVVLQPVGEPIDDFICSICHSMIVTPVVTPCNHMFCAICLRTSHLYKPQCPICRTQMDATSTTSLSDQILTFRVETYPITLDPPDIVNIMLSSCIDLQQYSGLLCESFQRL